MLLLDEAGGNPLAFHEDARPDRAMRGTTSLAVPGKSERPLKLRL